MATVLLILVVVLVVAALVFGVVSLLAGDDPGLVPAEPDERALPLPNTRSLTEADLQSVRFDVGLRGYRMAQVDRVLRRTAYDIGYKDEMIAVLEAEVAALREGRREDAELLRKARESAANPTPADPHPACPAPPRRAGHASRRVVADVEEAGAVALTGGEDPAKLAGAADTVGLPDGDGDDRDGDGDRDGDDAAAGALDAGSLDAGSLDAGSLDAGSLDAGSLDAGEVTERSGRG